MATSLEIQVWINNNTQAGCITFQSFSFMAPGYFSYSPGGYPSVIINTIPQGETYMALDTACVSNMVPDGHYMVQKAFPYTTGSAVFNLPGGETLTITWNLDALSPGNLPVAQVSGDTFAVTGLSPVFNGSIYTFNIEISPQ